MISELRRKFREIQDTKTSKKALDRIIVMMDSIVYENIIDKNTNKSDLPFNPFKDFNAFGSRKQLNSNFYIDFLSGKNGNVVSIRDIDNKVFFAFADQRKIGKIVHDFNTTEINILNETIEMLQPFFNIDFNLQETLKKNESLKIRRDLLLESIKQQIKNATLEDKSLKDLELVIKNRNIIQEVFVYNINIERPILRVEIKPRRLEHKIIVFNYDQIDDIEKFLEIEKKNYKNKLNKPK